MGWKLIMKQRLPNDWFVDGSYEQTLKNLIKSYEQIPDTLGDFKEALTRDILMLSAYPKHEERAVIDYIKNNGKKLYDFAKTVVKRRYTKQKG